MLKQNVAERDTAAIEETEGFAARLRAAGPRAGGIAFSEMYDMSLNGVAGDIPRDFGDYGR